MDVGCRVAGGCFRNCRRWLKLGANEPGGLRRFQPRRPVPRIRPVHPNHRRNCFTSRTTAASSATLYVLTEDQVLGEVVGNGQRYMTEAKFQVYRSLNSGSDWEPSSRRIPQLNTYLNSMREGMATNELNPRDIYIVTRSGQIFYSRIIPDNWVLLVDYLPPINSVDCPLVV